MSALVVSDLTVEYNSGGYVVRPLDGLSMQAADGQLVVLLGPSGCGKTTLLSCLAGLLKPTSGTIRHGDIEIEKLHGGELASYRQQQVGVVFQAFNLIPSLSARENVVVPMTLAGMSRRSAVPQALQLLDQVGLAERAHHRPGALSGGQQQRVAIARALAHHPPRVLADEPTAHLDHVQVEGVLQLIRRLASPGRMVIVATHDDRITHLADHVVDLAPRAVDNADREPERTTLAESEVLFRQGDRGDLVYVVEAGSIEIYRELADGGEEHVSLIGPGKYFGELGPMLLLPRSASARAVGATEVVGYPLHQFRLTHPGLSRF
jgi:putative ABC transport system ATP-binding protein